MVETIILSIIGAITGWYLSKSLRAVEEIKDTSTFKLHEIDYSLTREFEQNMEDDKHYRAFERAKLARDREFIGGYYLKTILEINESPELADCITDEKLEDITETYNDYIYMCDGLNELLRLTKEEFLIREENLFRCADFSAMGIMVNPFGDTLGMYTIYDSGTAKYENGNMLELMKAEFKARHY